MLVALAQWYLRKRKISTIIGMEVIGGTITALNPKMRIYDNEFFKGTIRAQDRTVIIVPEGSFKVNGGRLHD